MSVFDLLSVEGKAIMKEVIKNLSNTNILSVEEHDMDGNLRAPINIIVPIKDIAKGA
jgi:phosphoserine aminotransferase